MNTTNKLEIVTIETLSTVTGGMKRLTGLALDRYNAKMNRIWNRTMWEQMGRSAY